MDVDKIRIGLIGAGRMGKNHCRVYSTLRHVELVGIFDQNFAVGQKLAEQYQVPLFSNLDKLLESVDAVSIVTPTPTHFGLAIECLKRNIGVFVEKPITENTADAQILVNIAKDSGNIVQVGHIERFNPVYSELKNVLESMSVLAVNFRRLSPYAGSNTDVDVVLDLMIHDLDLALDLVGQEPIAIDAFGLTAFSGGIDHAVVNLRFAQGSLLTVTASRITEQKVRSIEVTALEAYTEADLLNKAIAVHRSTVGEYLQHNQRGVKYRQESIVERINVPIAEPLFLELQHFVDCVRHKTEPSVSAAHGLSALRLATMIRKTIHETLYDIGELQRQVSRLAKTDWSLATPLHS